MRALGLLLHAYLALSAVALEWPPRLRAARGMEPVHCGGA